MINFFKAVCRKVKSFRPNLLPILMIIFMTYRMFFAGSSIVLVGVCASIMPFMCQSRNYPARDGQSLEITEVFTDYFVNIFYMAVYMGYMIGISWLGMKYNPEYAAYPYFENMLLIAVCANMVFMSIVYTIEYLLSAKQRLMIGVILSNALIGFMLLNEMYIPNMPQIIPYWSYAAFDGLIFAVTVFCIIISYGNKERRVKNA